jgi:hypothetical protein
MPTVLPTHHCFDDAAEYVNERAKTEPRHVIEGLRLVHAIIQFPEGQPDAGRRTAHAWVEEGDWVIDAGLLEGERVYLHWPRAEYYTRMRVEAPSAYTALELLAYHDTHGHVGPWRADLRLLLRATNTPVVR